MSSQSQKMLLVGALPLCSGVVRAQSMHQADFLIRVTNQRLETGAVGPSEQAVYPVRVKAAVLGADGIPNFSNDPGVNAELGALIPGMSVGFDLLAALREWDGSTGFATLSEHRMTVRKSGINTVTPTTDSVVPGIVFGQADLDDGAGFHHHVQFILDPASGGTPSGLWLLAWSLWTDAPGIAPTAPVYIVFAQGDGVAEIDDAVAWVEGNLIGPPCVADFAAPFGVLNFFDVSAFLNLYNTRDDAADLAAPVGVWNFFDVSAFLGSYNAGCP